MSQDRADLGEAAKGLAQRKWKPSTSSVEDLNRLARYLLGRPSLALRYEQQRMPADIHVSIDRLFAAARATRKSTTGEVQRLGRHPIKTTSNLQTSAGLNVSECVFCALVHGAAHGLGLEAHTRDLRTDLPLIIESDTASAKAFASRRGLGKQGHARRGRSEQFRDQEYANSRQHQ